MILILMGVSGTGKTTLGNMVAAQTGWTFLDGDDFHPAANKAKMHAGHPLTDEDRAPWLAILHNKIEEYVTAGKGMILACSALKQSYRDTLRGDLPATVVQFALLTAPEQVLADHLAHRSHTFMNPNLLASQLATLETPTDAWVISVDEPVEESVAKLMAYLRTAGAVGPSQTA